jgi:hypothetical protein
MDLKRVKIQEQEKMVDIQKDLSILIQEDGNRMGIDLEFLILMARLGCLLINGDFMKKKEKDDNKFTWGDAVLVKKKCSTITSSR